MISLHETANRWASEIAPDPNAIGVERVKVRGVLVRLAAEGFAI